MDRRLFNPTHLEATVQALTDADDTAARVDDTRAALRRRIVAADSTMNRLQKALDAGWDPDALTDQYNAAVAQKKAAEAELTAVRQLDRLTADDIHSMVLELGDMATILDMADRDALADLYTALRLSVTYDHSTRTAVVSIRPSPRGGKVGVRGGT
jgi:hypothetical protein